jgi:hypothetical protein
VDYLKELRIRRQKRMMEEGVVESQSMINIRKRKQDFDDIDRTLSDPKLNSAQKL